MTRNEAYELLVWTGQLRYLDAVADSTEREVRKRVRMLELLLRRWKRGY